MAFGDFAVSRAGTKTVTGSDGNPVTYPANFPAFEFNAGGVSYRGVNTGDTDIWLADASSLIGQNAGTILFTIDLALSSINAPILTLNDGSDLNSIKFARTSDNRITFIVTVGGVVQVSIQTATGQSGLLKIGAGYELNNFVLCVNGVQIGTDVSGTVPACKNIGMGIDVIHALYLSQVDITWGTYDYNWSEAGANMTDAFAVLSFLPTRESNAQILSYT